MKARYSDMQVTVALCSLVFLLPCTISDLYNSDFLYYATPSIFLVLKVFVWLFLPVLVLTTVDRLTKSYRPVYITLVCYFFVGGAFYLTRSILYSIPLGVMFTLSWLYALPVIRSYYIFPLIIAVVWVIAGAIKLSPLSVYFLRETAQPHDALPVVTQQKLSLPFNVYVIIFDELAKAVLYDGNVVSSQFPNFREISERAVVPPYSTTNYDYTDLAIPTLLTGKLQDASLSPLQRYLHRNLFDLISPEKILLWGTDEPYCKSLALKKLTSRCVDEIAVLRRGQFSKLFAEDLSRFSQIYLMNVPAAMGLAVFDYFHLGEPNSPLENVRWRLVNSVMKSDLDLGMNKAERDFVRLDDFLPRIASQQNTLYYYHSYLPHYPYIADKNLNFERTYHDMAFYLAKTAEDVGRINSRYIKSVQAADTVLGRIMTVIKKKDPGSLVIVTSDHGVARTLGVALSRPAGKLLRDDLEIPLFIVLPDGHPLKHLQPGRYQHVDFLPTLLQLISPAQSDNAKFDGVSIFIGKESDFFFESKGVIFRNSALAK